MNVEANIASQNWEKLLSRIHGHSMYAIQVELTDRHADLYDFANEILMRRMRERLVEALRSKEGRDPFLYLIFGNKFFMTMQEQEQQSFFGSIFRLRAKGIKVGESTDNSTESPEITISTSALLETLPQLHRYVRILVVSNFALTHQSDVQAVSNIIRAKCGTLQSLSLTRIKFPVDDCYKKDSDEPNGFIDPLLYAASRLKELSVSTQTRSVHSTLVSPRALRALFVEWKQYRMLCLRGLGLTDSHVLAIVDGLSIPGTYSNCLDLDSNPGISAQGYDALLNLINRANLVDFIPDDYDLHMWPDRCGDYQTSTMSEYAVFRVDDKAWEGKLNLVSEMNSMYSRLTYLTNGTFTSEKSRWQWLERVANLPSSDEDDKNLPDWRKEENKESNAKHLSFIWYTLCHNPEMMQT